MFKSASTSLQEDKFPEVANENAQVQEQEVIFSLQNSIENTDVQSVEEESIELAKVEEVGQVEQVTTGVHAPIIEKIREMGFSESSDEELVQLLKKHKDDLTAVIVELLNIK